MSTRDDHEAMANACIEAAEHVNRSGSPELQAVMRVLLFILAGETMERAGLRAQTASGRSSGGEQA